MTIRPVAVRLASIAVVGLCACDVSSTVGYNEDALTLGPEVSCPPDASLRACSSDGCVTTQLSTAVIGIQAVAVDSENIFFVSAPGTLARLPVGGGVPVELTAELDQMRQLTVDADAVYWTEYDGRVRSVPKSGGGVTDVTTAFGHPWSIAADGDHVYVVLPESGDVAMAPTPAGPATRLAGQNVPFGIAVDAEHVYWINQGTPGALDGELVRAPRGDLTGAEVILSGLDAPVALALTTHAIVWATFDTIATVAKVGGSPVTLASGFAEAKAIAAFDGNVYLGGAHGLTRTAMADGTTLVLEPRGLTSLALGCDGVFGTGWTEPILIRYGR